MSDTCGVAGCTQGQQKKLQSDKSYISETFRFCTDHAVQKEAEYEDLEVIGNV